MPVCFLGKIPYDLLFITQWLKINEDILPLLNKLEDIKIKRKNNIFNERDDKVVSFAEDFINECRTSLDALIESFKQFDDAEKAEIEAKFNAACTRSEFLKKVNYDELSHDGRPDCYHHCRTIIDNHDTAPIDSGQWFKAPRELWTILDSWKYNLPLDSNMQSTRHILNGFVCSGLNGYWNNEKTEMVDKVKKHAEIIKKHRKNIDDIINY